MHTALAPYLWCAHAPLATDNEWGQTTYQAVAMSGLEEQLPRTSSSVGCNSACCKLLDLKNCWNL